MSTKGPRERVAREHAHDVNEALTGERKGEPQPEDFDHADRVFKLVADAVREEADSAHEMSPWDLDTAMKIADWIESGGGS